MTITNRQKMARGIFVPIFLFFMGIMAFTNAASRPSFETFKAIDIVRLIAVGMCFGAAIVALFVFFRRDHANNPRQE